MSRLRELREKKAAIQWHLDYCAGQKEAHARTADAYARQIDALKEELVIVNEDIRQVVPDLSRPIPIHIEMEVVS